MSTEVGVLGMARDRSGVPWLQHQQTGMYHQYIQDGASAAAAAAATAAQRYYPNHANVQYQENLHQPLFSRSVLVAHYCVASQVFRNLESEWIGAAHRDVVPRVAALPRRLGRSPADRACNLFQPRKHLSVSYRGVPWLPMTPPATLSGPTDQKQTLVTR